MGSRGRERTFRFGIVSFVLTRSPGASRFAAILPCAAAALLQVNDADTELARLLEAAAPGTGTVGVLAAQWRALVAAPARAEMRRLAGELSVPLQVGGRSSPFKPVSQLRSEVRAELLARARRESTLLAGAAEPGGGDSVMQEVEESVDGAGDSDTAEVRRGI